MGEGEGEGVTPPTSKITHAIFLGSIWMPTCLSVEAVFLPTVYRPGNVWHGRLATFKRCTNDPFRGNKAFMDVVKPFEPWHAKIFYKLTWTLPDQVKLLGVDSVSLGNAGANKCRKAHRYYTSVMPMCFSTFRRLPMCFSRAKFGL